MGICLLLTCASMFSFFLVLSHMFSLSVTLCFSESSPLLEAWDRKHSQRQIFLPLSCRGCGCQPRGELSVSPISCLKANKVRVAEGMSLCHQQSRKVLRFPCERTMSTYDKIFLVELYRDIVL